MVWLDFLVGASACVAWSCFFEKNALLMYARGASSVNLYIDEERTMCWRLMIVASCHHDMTADESYWSMQNYDSLVD